MNIRTKNIKLMGTNTMKTINFEYRKVCLNVLPVPMNQHRGYKTQPKKNFKDYLKATIKGLSLSVMPMSFFWLPFVKGIGSNINVGPLASVRLRTQAVMWFDKLVKLNVQCVKSRRGGKLC